MAALILGLMLAGCSGNFVIGQPPVVVVAPTNDGVLDTLVKAQELRVAVRQLAR